MVFKDKVALISGATSGVGKANALLFASEGARVGDRHRLETCATLFVL